MSISQQYFSQEYYLSQNADVKTGWAGSALDHYLRYGAAENRSPNSWFDGRYYQSANADLAGLSAAELFEHYLVNGRREGRVPSAGYAGFDSADYVERYAEEFSGKVEASTALSHYLLFGAGEGRTARTTDGAVMAAPPIITTTASLSTGADLVSASFIHGAPFHLGGRVVDVVGNSDILVGTGGKGDTLEVALGGGGNVYRPLLVRGIEIVKVGNTNDFGGTATLSLEKGDASVTTVKTAGNVNGVLVTNIASAPAVFEVADTAAAFTATVQDAALSGKTDTATLVLKDVTAGAKIALGPVNAGSGYESLFIQSGGSGANSIILDDGIGDSLATVHVSGASDLALALTPKTVTVVDAARLTGKLTLAVSDDWPAVVMTGGAGDDALSGGAGDDTINGGAGNDTISGGAGTNTLNGGAGDDILIGGSGADTLNGGEGNDLIVNAGKGAKTSSLDMLTGGEGRDTFVLRGDTEGGDLWAVINKTSHVTDFTVGVAAKPGDIIALSSVKTDYAHALTGFAAGIAANAAGATKLTVLGKDAVSAAYDKTSGLIKLTTAVDATGLTLQNAFDSAMGTAKLTGFAAGQEIFVSLYDSGHKLMLLLLCDTVSGTGTILEKGDPVSLIGSLSITAADYANFSSANLAMAGA